jgi:Xaa-Pro aminopeptidase
MGAQEIRIASHDLPVSDRLAEFMRTSWADTSRVDLTPVPQAANHARRRAALAALFPDDTLVIPTGRLIARNNDADHPFRPGSDFVWLTGYHEPDAVLVVPAGQEPVLYVRPRSDRGSDGFFRDRVSGELWVGRRWSVAETAALLAVATAPLADLPKRFADLDPARVRLLGDRDAEVDGALRSPAAAAEPASLADAELATALSELRLVKDSWEVAQLQDAVDATARGFADVVRALPADRESAERLVDGVFGLRARHDGNTVGYSSIAAAGTHACTLHWIRNDGRCRPGDLLLLDAGVENDHFYTADVTRTLPVSGRFSEPQRRIYDLVLAAQEAGIDTVRPGVRWRDVNAACMRVLAYGLAELGILPIDPAESLDDDAGLHRRWTLHASGHMLGLDVHDCARARAETYQDGVLAAGHVLTVEPGLYFQLDDELVPTEYRGIGVRIEDDVLVTADGCRVLSAALPKRPAEVESWMAAERAAGPRLPG